MCEAFRFPHFFGVTLPKYRGWGFTRLGRYPTWRIIPVSKWLVTIMFKPWKGHLERKQPYLGDSLTMLLNHVLTEIVLQEPRPALLKNSWNRLAHRQPVFFSKNTANCWFFKSICVTPNLLAIIPNSTCAWFLKLDGSNTICWTWNLFGVGESLLITYEEAWIKFQLFFLPGFSHSSGFRHCFPRSFPSIDPSIDQGSFCNLKGSVSLAVNKNSRILGGLEFP